LTTKIALVGNPNSGKTTLFNALTGSNQHVGNWPGVTVEQKTGRLKTDKDVEIVDLPGIYSLSPYTLEEVIARNYLIDERPDVILNIVDGTNLERNLYLTTQVVEMGLPVVVAINMADLFERNGITIDTDKLGEELGCEVVKISALKEAGAMEAAQLALSLAQSKPEFKQHHYSPEVEHALAHIEEAVVHDQPEEQQRWYSIKLFERDEKVAERLQVTPEKLAHIEGDIKKAEEQLDEDSVSIITSERYYYISDTLADCLDDKNRNALSISDKIDRVVTNRILALPIFVIVMFIVYFISISSVGTLATDWANDGVFGDGWYIGGGAEQYEEAAGEFDSSQEAIKAYLLAANEADIDIEGVLGIETDGAEMPDTDELIETEFEGYTVAVVNNPDALTAFAEAAQAAELEAGYEVIDEATGEVSTEEVSLEDFIAAAAVAEPDPASFGIWVPGIPILATNALEAINCVDWLQALIVDGIIGGVGAVLGFVPQMMVLFILLAFLEGCGYMSRIAFILDRVFRRFGLSGKSFIPILIGTGCGVPGIMASRTIENQADRRMTIMTTTFIPCSAKLPVIALIAGALFGGVWWVAPSAYFLGIAAIICTGIILKKTKIFAGETSPFVMELPAYHWPTPGSVLRVMWERAWSFIKRAGTIILAACVLIWFLSSFGFGDDGFGLVDDMNDSILAAVGGAIAWIFSPLGWGDWRSAVAAITGLIAKESVVGTMGVLFSGGEVAENGVEIWPAIAANYTMLTAYAFLVFNLLCAPCFAAIGAIRREMNNIRWFWFAIGYQCVFAYIVSLWIFQFGTLIGGGGFGVGSAIAIVLFAAFLFMLFRPDPQKRASKLTLASSES
jgi:ferrous iron transport protein B